jgi:sigma-B regulation protein RsbQ
MDVLTRNQVATVGEGARTLVLAHGFGTDQAMWRFLVPFLAPAGRLVLFDHVGSGRSDLAAYRHDRHASLDGYAEDLLEILRALDLHDVVFVGHSVGGMIGVRAAVAEPARFSHLVLIGSSASYLDDPPGYRGGFSLADVHGLLDTMRRNFEGWAKETSVTAMAQPDRPELGRELERSFCSLDRGVALAFATATFLSDTRPLLARVRAPSLVLQSARDVFVPRSAAEHLQRNLPGATLHVLPSQGHFPHFSDPAEVARVIFDHLGPR